MIEEDHSKSVHHQKRCTVRGLRDALDRYMGNHPNLADEPILMVHAEMETAFQVRGLTVMTGEDHPGIEAPCIVIGGEQSIETFFDEIAERQHEKQH